MHVWLFVSCADHQHQSAGSPQPKIGFDTVSYKVETPEDILSGITVYDFKRSDDGMYTVKSLQIAYPELKAKAPLQFGSRIAYTFLSAKTGEAFRFTRVGEDTVLLRIADTEARLEEKGAYAEQAFQPYESGTWAVSDSIEPIIFFEELSEALDLAQGRSITLDLPKLEPRD